MTTLIHQEDLIESVADALQFISYYHPKDFIQAVYEAYNSSFGVQIQPIKVNTSSF